MKENLHFKIPSINFPNAYDHHATYFENVPHQTPLHDLSVPTSIGRKLYIYMFIDTIAEFYNRAMDYSEEFSETLINTIITVPCQLTITL
mgnify:FL=1